MSKSNRSSIGTKIKQAREKAGLSRRKFMMILRSLGVDVTETTIFNWENEITEGPSARQFIVIMKALKTKPNFFCS